MRVLYFASDNNISHGAFRSLAKLSSVLQHDYGVETCIVLPYQGNGQALLEQEQVSFTTVVSRPWIIPVHAGPKMLARVPVRWAKNLYSIKKIEKLIAQYKPDIVHINTTYSYVGAIAAHRFGIPVVWHLREYLEEDQNCKIWNRKLGYRLINRSDRIIAISKDLYRKYQGIFSDEKFCVVYNGIDVKDYYDGSHDILKNEKVYMSCVGGLYPGKGQGLLIRALAIATKKGISDFALHLIGNGSEEANLRKLVSELGLEKQVVFEGFQSDTVRYYRQSDIVFMVSRSEAFGRVTVEAMLGGALVIGSDSGGTSEILQENRFGYLYRKGNADDLAERIIQALNNRTEAAETARAGREMAYRTFTSRRNAEEILAIYNELLK